MNLDQDLEMYRDVCRQPAGIFVEPREVRRLERHIMEYHGADPHTGAPLRKEKEDGTEEST